MDWGLHNFSARSLFKSAATWGVGSVRHTEAGGHPGDPGAPPAQRVRPAPTRETAQWGGAGEGKNSIGVRGRCSFI